MNSNFITSGHGFKGSILTPNSHTMQKMQTRMFIKYNTWNKDR